MLWRPTWGIGCAAPFCCLWTLEFFSDLLHRVQINEKRRMQKRNQSRLRPDLTLILWRCDPLVCFPPLQIFFFLQKYGETVLTLSTHTVTLGVHEEDTGPGHQLQAGHPPAPPPTFPVRSSCCTGFYEGVWGSGLDGSGAPSLGLRGLLNPLLLCLDRLSNRQSC